MNRLQKNWLEWSVFALASVLVTGVVGFLILEGWDGNSAPPVIQVELGTARRLAHHHALPVTVTNLGDHSAEQVHIEVVLEFRDGTRQQARMVFPHLPRKSTREGWVAFDIDPASALRISARQMSYTAP